MKNNYIFFSFLFFMLSCSSNDPNDMALEYCECLNNKIQDSDKQECADLARRHKEKLDGNPDKMKKYADELIKCTNVSR